MQTVTQVTFRRWIAHDCTIFAALLFLCERQADQNRNLSDKNDTYPTELWFQQHKTQIWISTTKMGFRHTKERGNWNFTLAGLFWIDSPWTRLIVFRLSWRTVLMFIIYFIIFLDAQKGTVIIQESTEALKLHISHFAAMATAKVKNAMFFKVKESCIKLAAGYRSTEKVTDWTCIETLFIFPQTANSSHQACSAC